MKISAALATAALAALIATGCATPGAVKEPVNNTAAEGREWFKNPWICAAGGALVAGGLTSTESAEAGLLGAAIGGAVGYFACNWEEKPLPDADGDGVPDKADVCPGTAKGAKVKSNGCPEDYDTDGDGVPDSRDQCAATPKGLSVDANGCVPTADMDGDGVPDVNDLCPNTPRGASVLPNGCEVDSDADGVPDSRDRCDGTPAGVDVGTDGCAVDTDGDGVPDVLDRCPSTRTGAKVDGSGCENGAGAAKASSPLPSTPPITSDMVLEGVTFETASAKLRRESFPVLDKVAEQLKMQSDVRIEVAGFTDSRGSEAINRALSQRRAEMVMSYLVAKGVPAGMLVAKGYGPDQPVGDNETEEGRAANRRVELRPLAR